MGGGAPAPERAPPNGTSAQAWREDEPGPQLHAASSRLAGQLRAQGLMVLVLAQQPSSFSSEFFFFN